MDLPRFGGEVRACDQLQSTARRAVGKICRISDQLAAVPPGREIEPASASAEETALVCEAEQVSCLREREVEPTEVLPGELTARTVEQRRERGGFRLQAPLQRALAHAQLARDNRHISLARQAARQRRVVELQKFKPG